MQAAAVFTITLPAWFLFPDGTNGAWRDCYKDTNKVLLLNAFLYLLDLAQKLQVSTYIETIADCDLLCNGVTTVARFYRVFVPLSEANVREACIRVATEMQTNNLDSVNPEPTVEPRAAKRRRRDSSSFGFNQASMDGTEPIADILTNTHISVDRFRNEKVLLQYYTTISAGNPLEHVDTIHWAIPPQELTTGGDGALHGTFDDTGDLDSDDDFLGSSHPANSSSTVSAVSTLFQQFYAELPNNHLLKIFGIENRFDAGLQKFNTVHDDQLDINEYWQNNVFRMPEF